VETVFQFDGAPPQFSVVFVPCWIGSFGYEKGDPFLGPLILFHCSRVFLSGVYKRLFIPIKYKT
jgi:hypothetical protein